MTHTGVFATDAEQAELIELLHKAETTPVMALSSAQALSGNDFSVVAQKRAREKCHALALAHGLPEVPGYYGMGNDGEFLGD